MFFISYGGIAFHSSYANKFMLHVVLPMIQYKLVVGMLKTNGA
jgi:hypothetical protein